MNKTNLRQEGGWDIIIPQPPSFPLFLLDPLQLAKEKAPFYGGIFIGI